MSQYSKRNNRKRPRSKRPTPNQRQGGRSTTSNNDDSDVPSHSCPWNSSMESISSMDPAAVSKLITDIKKLKAHLTSAHTDLKELSRHNLKFKKTMNKYKKKLDFIDKAAFGSNVSEPGPSTSKTVKEKSESSESEDETSSTSSSGTPARPTSSANLEDEEDDSDEESEDDDDSEEDEEDDDDEEDEDESDTS